MSTISRIAYGLRVIQPNIGRSSRSSVRYSTRVRYTTVKPQNTTSAAKIPSYVKTPARSASAAAPSTNGSRSSAVDNSAPIPSSVLEAEIEEIERATAPTTPTADAAVVWSDGAPADMGPLPEPGDGRPTDWSRSYHGLSSQPFPKDIAEILMAPLDPEDVEIKPDGLIYLPEIKYRRILNKAFGPGGWGLAPRGETNVSPKVVSREYALVCLGRLVGIARGEQEYFDPSGIATATEACKSNALMRCCKDLGIASELWDPRFIREFKAKHCSEVFATHVVTQRKKKLWRRKGDKLEYPYKE